ncbi:LysR substrate-binding domain-containing protein [Chromatocurvus halotolerans]|uniref:DNA-binding transcriptional LysR family regulator n=1 Tax=Chromatocurvus halotolerans TaxID=1132028 RepID=A0A4R2KPR9_9GAMM|nr:LysR family transcriptional regulator [Chromatocurvus halotolerans]TCO74647.1 DNA-binding transcriptional LysR family regulator [Chromatocurvus halotolerans]
MAKTTLEQWRMLLAVVTHGGFAQAAAATHKSQSSINHAVHKLQDQLGLQLLEVVGRKAQLTESGSLMLRRASQLLDQANQLEDLASGLAEGIEAEIRVALDEVLPPTRIAATLETLAAEFPHTRVELIETVLWGGPETLMAGKADLLVADTVPQGFLGTPLLTTTFVAVAAPGHVLHTLHGPLNMQDLAQHRQIVVRDSSVHRRTDAGWLGAEQRWTVTHVSTSIDMVCRGLGFAWLPMTRISKLLDDGLLRKLPLERGGYRPSTLYLTLADTAGSGPATLRLSTLLAEALFDGE